MGPEKKYKSVIYFFLILERGSGENDDRLKWIFEEQEAQIKSDRSAIARLNCELDKLARKRNVLR